MLHNIRIKIGKNAGIACILNGVFFYIHQSSWEFKLLRKFFHFELMEEKRVTGVGQKPVYQPYGTNNRKTILVRVELQRRDQPLRFEIRKTSLFRAS